MRSPHPSRLKVVPDAASLATEAARRIAQASQESIAERGGFTLVLSGGRTPEAAYQRLAAPVQSPPVDWTRTYLFFGDERFVPHDDPRSNHAMIARSLVDRVGISSDHLHPMPTDTETPAQAAAAYALELAAFFGLPETGPPPRFDLILLGLGDDGHTASLFPNQAAVDVTDAWVTWSPPGAFPPPVDRITLTFPVLNAARQVLFLVSGSNKAAPLRDVMEGQFAVRDRPATGVRPIDGSLTWLVDSDAACFLSRREERSDSGSDW
jgi:6-phosphogluconolactonase